MFLRFDYQQLASPSTSDRTLAICAREWAAGNFKFDGQEELKLDKTKLTLTSYIVPLFERALKDFLSTKIPEQHQKQAEDWILQHAGFSEETSSTLLPAMMNAGFDYSQKAGAAKSSIIKYEHDRLSTVTQLPGLIYRFEDVNRDQQNDPPNTWLEIEKSVSFDQSDRTTIKSSLWVEPVYDLDIEVFSKSLQEQNWELSTKKQKALSFDLDMTTYGVFSADRTPIYDITPEILTVMYFCQAVEFPLYINTNRCVGLSYRELLSAIVEPKIEYRVQPSHLTLYEPIELLNKHGVNPKVITQFDEFVEDKDYSQIVMDFEKQYLAEYEKFEAKGQNKAHEFYSAYKDSKEFKSNDLRIKESELFEEHKNQPGSKDKGKAIQFQNIYQHMLKKQQEEGLEVSILHIDDDQKVITRIKENKESNQLHHGQHVDSYHFQPHLTQPGSTHVELLEKMARFTGLRDYAFLLLQKANKSKGEDQKVFEELSENETVRNKQIMKYLAVMRYLIQSGMALQYPNSFGKLFNEFNDNYALSLNPTQQEAWKPLKENCYIHHANNWIKEPSQVKFLPNPFHNYCAIRYIVEKERENTNQNMMKQFYATQYRYLDRVNKERCCDLVRARLSPKNSGELFKEAAQQKADRDQLSLADKWRLLPTSYKVLAGVVSVIGMGAAVVGGLFLGGVMAPATLGVSAPVGAYAGIKVGLIWAGMVVGSFLTAAVSLGAVGAYVTGTPNMTTKNLEQVKKHLIYPPDPAPKLKAAPTPVPVTPAKTTQTSAAVLTSLAHANATQPKLTQTKPVVTVVPSHDLEDQPKAKEIIKGTPDAQPVQGAQQASKRYFP